MTSIVRPRENLSERMLIVSVSVGAGHVRAAEALQEALTAADPGRPLEHVDALELAPGWVRRFYRESFMRVAARSRRLAYHLYTGTDGDDPDDVRWGHVAERLVFRRFARLLRSGRWADCLCTHFLPCQLVPSTGAPRMHVVLTDWALHRFWVQPMAHTFFVATESLAATLRRRVPGARTVVTGIPVAGCFARPYDREAVRRQLDLDPLAPTVLLVGGGWGLGVPEMVRPTLAAQVPGLQLLVVCGANHRAYRALASSPCARVRPFGFVGDIARLMAAADLVIAKPGGVTTSEALALGRPLLLTRGLPGHEDRNANWLTQTGAAHMSDETTLPGHIERFFQDALLRERWTRAAAAAGRPDAARRIAAYFDEPAERRTAEGSTVDAPFAARSAAAGD